MIPAAILGFSVGAVIAWTVLRSLSHGASDYLKNFPPLASDPMDEIMPGPNRKHYMDEVQTADPYVRRFFLDCE